MFMRRMAGAWTGLGDGRGGGARRGGPAIKRLDRRRKLALIAAFRPGTAEK